MAARAERTEQQIKRIEFTLPSGATKRQVEMVFTAIQQEQVKNPVTDDTVTVHAIDGQVVFRYEREAIKLAKEAP